MSRRRRDAAALPRPSAKVEPPAAVVGCRGSSSFDNGFHVAARGRSPVLCAVDSVAGHASRRSAPQCQADRACAFDPAQFLGNVFGHPPRYGRRVSGKGILNQLRQGRRAVVVPETNGLQRRLVVEGAAVGGALGFTGVAAVVKPASPKRIATTFGHLLCRVLVGSAHTIANERRNEHE